MGSELGPQQRCRMVKGVKRGKDINRQGNISITKESAAHYVKRIPNRKAPGPDLVQGFWLKHFTSLHQRIAHQLQDCLLRGNVPKWMTRSRTVLIMKDPEKGTSPGNYRPKTCLPVIWKMLTRIISEEVYQYLDREDLLPEEQKGC